jgi:hypothetical protein
MSSTKATGQRRLSQRSRNASTSTATAVSSSTVVKGMKSCVPIRRTSVVARLKRVMVHAISHISRRQAIARPIVRNATKAAAATGAVMSSNRAVVSQMSG